MKRIDALRALHLATLLVILDQKTGQITPWRLNEEQRIVLAALTEHARVVVLKGRQVGISTVCCLYDLLYAVQNPGVSVAIVAHTHDAALGLLRKVKAWAGQLKIALTIDQEKTITLANGATIDALSAVSHADEGQSRVGRSKSYGMIHASELAFWGNAAAVFGALTSTALPNAKVIVESTATPASPNLFRSIWDDENGEWHHVFLSVEEHATYRADPASITDDEWARLQAEYQFTRRDSAAWWAKKLATDFLGDHHAAMREYPVVAHQAFSFAKGRWILRYTPADPPPVVDGPWHTYIAKPDEAVVLGVDTALGLGRDSSAIAVVGRETGRLVALWKSNLHAVPTFIDELKAACATWKPAAVVIESNGIGGAVYQTLLETRWPVFEQVSSDRNGEKELRMRRVKHAIETGRIPCGEELAHEVLHSIRGPKGEWQGPDDALNAVSFCLAWVALNPASRAATVTLPPRNVFVPRHGRKGVRRY